jgi:hypothetical protein
LSNHWRERSFFFWAAVGLVMSVSRRVCRGLRL